MRQAEHAVKFSVEEKISAIKNWAEGDPKGENFNTVFVDDMEKNLEDFGGLTPPQEEGLDNIIRGFKIDVDRWKDD